MSCPQLSQETMDQKPAARKIEKEGDEEKEDKKRQPFDGVSEETTGELDIEAILVDSATYSGEGDDELDREPISADLASFPRSLIDNKDAETLGVILPCTTTGIEGGNTDVDEKDILSVSEAVADFSPHSAETALMIEKNMHNYVPIAPQSPGTRTTRDDSQEQNDVAIPKKKTYLCKICGAPEKKSHSCPYSKIKKNEWQDIRHRLPTELKGKLDDHTRKQGPRRSEELSARPNKCSTCKKPCKQCDCVYISDEISNFMSQSLSQSPSNVFRPSESGSDTEGEEIMASEDIVKSVSSLSIISACELGISLVPFPAVGRARQEKEEKELISVLLFLLRPRHHQTLDYESFNDFVSSGMVAHL